MSTIRKMPSFITPKVAFYKPKSHLLQAILVQQKFNGISVELWILKSNNSEFIKVNMNLCRKFFNTYYTNRISISEGSTRRANTFNWFVSILQMVGISMELQQKIPIKFLLSLNFYCPQKKTQASELFIQTNQATNNNWQPNL